MLLLACALLPRLASATETPTGALQRLDALLAAHPADLQARAERARLREDAGLSMQAFLDRREILRLAPGDAVAARLAAYNLMAAGAPGAAAELVKQFPVAVAGAEGAALQRQLAGDLAARHVRWGWDEPIFDPARRRHEAEQAIALLEARRREDPTDQRAAGDLLLAYRLADRTADAVRLWKAALDRPDAPYWQRNAAADSYLAEKQPAQAETLYRSFAAERSATPQPWLGLYWSAVEQRHYADAAAALDQLAKVPGQQLTAEIQRGWLLLFADRTVEGQRRFEALADRYPGDPLVRQGLATSYLWQGWQRQGLRAVEDLLARTTEQVPRVDNPEARIARAGALAALGDLGAARHEAADLVAAYPENVHAQRLRRDVDTLLSPEARLEGRYDTSDRGLGESWGQLEVSVPLGTRARVAAGANRSHAEDDRYRRGDVEDAYLGLSVRPSRWLTASGEVDFDLASDGRARDPGYRARLGLLPDDHWRIDGGYANGTWRDLPLRARASGLVADTADLGVAYTASPRWNARAGGGRSEISDGNVRTWELLAGEVLARQGPVYRAHLALELYASANTRSDVPYYSPPRDRSALLTHRSEWVTANSPDHRHTLSLLANVGVYDEEGFAAGPVGGLWLQSDWDLAGRTVLVVGAGARSQLYDGSRELDPRLYITLRRRF